MAGGLVKYRHLSRNSAHRRALLRNLVTSLVDKESIHTTYAKAKEAQRMADKLITMAKRNNETARRQAQSILFMPHRHMAKLFNELRLRYANRAGGYTRVLRTEPKDKLDQGESAILELVDGKRDMRFHLTAATVARDRQNGEPHADITILNMKKVTQGRTDGMKTFEQLVNTFMSIGAGRWGADENEVVPEPDILEGDEDLTDEQIEESRLQVEEEEASAKRIARGRENAKQQGKTIAGDEFRLMEENARLQERAAKRAMKKSQCWGT